MFCLGPGDAEPVGGVGNKDEGRYSTPETDGTLQWGCFNCRDDDRFWNFRESQWFACKNRLRWCQFYHMAGVRSSFIVR